MRNLKRALSLGLTAAMISGLMVMGSSAASYADVTSEDNQEAIEVLQAVEIMVGDENGDFNPDQNVTRNEMAVVMSNLMAYNVATYKDTSPFTDVPSWAEPYVAACYTNGITAGTSATTYGGDQDVTTAQAALMIMKALGYFQYGSDFGSDWQLSTVRQGNNIDLFSGVDSGVEEAMTRNDVAQLVLNTLKSGTVQAETNGSLTVGNVTIATDVQYNYVTSNQAYASSIDNDRRTNNDGDLVSGYIVELGEQLYMGDLELNDDDIDDFGRPSRTWIYDGQDVGTYAKKELLKASYTTEVEGGDIYSDIGSAACNYDLAYWVDGEKLSNSDTAKEADKLERRNDDPMKTTGNGVLTEVYVDADAEETTIVEVHTYLAQAANDYSETSGRLTVDIYIGRVDGKAEEQTTSRRLEVEDLPAIANYNEGDFMLVTMADGEVKSVADPEVISEVAISAYSSKSDDGEENLPSRLSSVTSDGTKYDVSAEAYYDAEYLFDYSEDRQQMYEHTYDLLLDPYGYLIGLDNVTDNTNSFFIVGYTPRNVNWGDAIDDALVIFPDGTMDEVKVMERDGVKDIADSGVVNTWYDYSINEDGVYEIHGVTEDQFIWGGKEIDGSNATLSAEYRVDIDKYVAGNYVYGDDESVYITVDLTDKNDAIEDVSSVVTGLRNTNILLDEEHKLGNSVVTNKTWKGNVFGLYDDDGFVTYAIAIGEDGANDLVYLVSGIKEAEQRGSVTYYGYDAILPESDEITRVWTKNLTKDNDTHQLTAHNLYKATYDDDGNIIKMEWKEDTDNEYSTDDYKTNGYAQVTLENADGAKEFIERGSRTMWFVDDADNQNYILLAPDCLFFVNGEDDGDGDYDLYGSMSAALTALGTTADGKHLLTPVSKRNAKFVAMTNSNGQATTIIFYDREYEDVGDVGGGADGRDTFAIAQTGKDITLTYTDYADYVGEGADAILKYRAIGADSWSNLGEATYSKADSSTGGDVKTYVYNFKVELNGNYEVYAEFVKDGDVLATTSSVTIYG